MKKILFISLLGLFIYLGGCGTFPAAEQLNTLIGKNYQAHEARCPQCFDYRLTGDDKISYLPDGRSFRMGDPNPSAVIYRETLTETEYLRTWLANCTYILTVRKSDGVITSWRYATEDRKNCKVW